MSKSDRFTTFDIYDLLCCSGVFCDLMNNHTDGNVPEKIDAAMSQLARELNDFLNEKESQS